MAMRFESMELKRQKQIDRLCRDYEDAWYGESPPSLSEFVARSDEHNRTAALLELVATDMELRLAHSHEVPVQEYLAQFSDHRDEISEVYERIIGESAIESPSSLGTPMKRLGDYRLLREVGRGGMGVVYEAVQESLGRTVALKVLPAELASTPDRVSRFSREAKMIARLHHSNIIEVYGSGESDGTRYIAMQFIIGQGLDRILACESNRREFCESTFGSSELSWSDHSASSAVAPTRILSQNKSAMATTLSFIPSPRDDLSNEVPLLDAPLQNAPSDAPLHNVPLQDAPLQHAPGYDASASGAAKSPETTAVPRPSGSGPDHVAARPLPDGRGTVRSPLRFGQSKTSRTTTNFAVELGRTMAERFRSAARIGQQMASALGYAHTQGVLHRDVKPSNILLDDHGTAWLADFGLAKSLESDTVVTQAGNVVGTLRYMAPEVLQGRADARTDLFALGLTLYELVSGQPAFGEAERSALIHEVATRSPLRLEKWQADVPRDLATIIHKTIEREPSDRYQTAEALAEDLRRFQSDEPILARRASLWEQAQRWQRRNRALAALLATVAVLVSVLAIGSTIAAGYFRTINSRLTSTVGDLSNTQGELRGKVDDLTKASEELTVARNDSLTMLADMQTERGIIAGQQGHPATAAVWFANAAALTPHDPQRQEANRRRTQSYLNEVPLPVALLKLPGRDANRLSFQPSGKLLFVMSGGQLQVWDWRSDRVSPWSESLTNVSDAAWSPDGKQLAVSFNNGDVRLIEPSSGNELCNFHHADRPEVLLWSPNGSRLAVASSRVQIWDVAQKPVCESDWSHPQRVYGLNFNRAGTRLITACDDAMARMFAVGNAELSAPLYAPVAHATSARRAEAAPVFCDENRKFVAVSPDRIPTLWDAASGQIVNSGWRNFGYQLDRDLAVSPDGRWVAISGYSGCALLRTDGRSVDLKHTSHVDTALFDPAGQWLLTTCWDGTARLWPLAELDRSTEPVMTPLTISQRGTLANGAFSPDGSCLAIAAAGEVVIWERPQSKAFLGMHSWDHARRPRLSANGQLVTTGLWHGSPVTMQPFGTTLSVMRTADGQTAGPTIHLDGLQVDSCVCGDNRLVAVVCKQDSTGTLSLFEIATGQLAHPSTKLPAVPISVADRPNQSQVAVLCENGTLQVFDTNAGRLAFEMDHPGWLGQYNQTRVTYSPDGATLVSVTPNTMVFVREAQTGQLRFPPITEYVNGVSAPCRALAFSPDNRLLAIATNSQNQVQVWDLFTGEKVGPSLLHPGDLYGLWSVAFSPDGTRIATGHKDHLVRLWDWRAGTLVSKPLQHANEVYDMQFTPDGRYLLSAVRYSSVHVWDVATSKLVIPLVRDRAFNTFTTDTVRVTGNRLIVGADRNYGIFDLSALIPTPRDDLPTLLIRSELSANQMLQQGELIPLDLTEWNDRWSRWKQK